MLACHRLLALKACRFRERLGGCSAARMQSKLRDMCKEMRELRKYGPCHNANVICERPLTTKVSDRTLICCAMFLLLFITGVVWHNFPFPAVMASSGRLQDVPYCVFLSPVWLLFETRLCVLCLPPVVPVVGLSRVCCRVSGLSVMSPCWTSV